MRTSRRGAGAGAGTLLALAALALVVCGSAREAAAHQAGMGMLLVDFGTEGANVGYRLDGTALANHLRIISEDRLPTLEELEPGRELIQRYLAEHLRLTTDGVPCDAFAIDEMELGPADSHFIDVAGHIECPQRLGLTELANSVLLDALPDYQTYGIFRTAQGRLENAFGRGSTRVQVPVGPPVEPGAGAGAEGSGAGGGAGGGADAEPVAFEPTTPIERVGHFIVLGIEHIVPKGTDHILFIIGLTVAAVSFRRLLGIVTAFTLSHSLTLGLAAFEVVTVPIAVAEAAIALSVAWVGLENVVTRPKRRWLLAFCFGLIHGIGFSAVLRELVAGTDITVGQRVQELLGFNVGVELGQIIVVAAVFPLVWLARRRGVERWLVVPVSLGVFGFGMVWFLERVGVFG